MHQHTEPSKQPEELWRSAAVSRDPLLCCDKRINLLKCWSRCLISSENSHHHRAHCTHAVPVASEITELVYGLISPSLHFYLLKNSSAPVKRPDFVSKALKLPEPFLVLNGRRTLQKMPTLHLEWGALLEIRSLAFRKVLHSHSISLPIAVHFVHRKSPFIYFISRMQTGCLSRVRLY